MRNLNFVLLYFFLLRTSAVVSGCIFHSSDSASRITSARHRNLKSKTSCSFLRGGALFRNGLFSNHSKDIGAISQKLDGNFPSWLSRLKSREDLRVRTVSTITMITLFTIIIYLGQQSGCALLVSLLQLGVYKEVMHTIEKSRRKRNVSWIGLIFVGITAIGRFPYIEAIRRTNEVVRSYSRGRVEIKENSWYKWGVFSIFSVFSYGQLLGTEALQAAEPLGPVLKAFIHWKLPVFALMYIGMFIRFITYLQSRENLRFELEEFAAYHFAAFVCLSSTLVCFSMRAGLFWFVLPSLLVIVNDIAAYLCGCMFGKTKLTTLSPRKTVEGFVGATLLTAITSVILTRSLLSCSWLFKGKNVFLRSLNNSLNSTTIISNKVEFWGIKVSEAEFHAIGLSLLGSLIGPFGGFFASAVKRAYGAKDFGKLIPGHGGIADRFDCQVLLLPLVYFYMKAFCANVNI